MDEKGNRRKYRCITLWFWDVERLATWNKIKQFKTPTSSINGLAYIKIKNSVSTTHVNSWVTDCRKMLINLLVYIYFLIRKAEEMQ